MSRTALATLAIAMTLPFLIGFTSVAAAKPVSTTPVIWVTYVPDDGGQCDARCRPDCTWSNMGERRQLSHEIVCSNDGWWRDTVYYNVVGD